MNRDDFGTWWPCLRKHYKRTKLWLPEIRKIAESLGDSRSIRYFTLCARPMIDVYMLVHENVVSQDASSRRIEGVSFCELDETIFPEMKELVGVEEAGFLAKLEDLLLFSDVAETELLDSPEEVAAYLDQQGEGIQDEVRDTLELKRKHLQLRGAFPFDFLNLDFCNQYYGESPNVMAIQKAIEKILDWQLRPIDLPGGKQTAVERFTMAVTCRVGEKVDDQIAGRLRQIVSRNAEDHPEYANALGQRGTQDVRRWQSDHPLDFFMSAWPKEIARAAKERTWNIAVKSHAFYDRRSRSGVDYHMVCLILEFERAKLCGTYLSAVLDALDVKKRIEITRFDNPLSPQGRALLQDLTEIVRLRNKQAVTFAREPLPDPQVALTELRRQGVTI